jgi:16S rRNA processing protein RimM
VGYIRAAHGIRGEVYAVIPSGEWSWAAKEVVLWLRPRNSKDPFQSFTIKSFRPHKEGLLLHFQEIKDRNGAEDLKGFVLHLPQEEFVSAPGEALYLTEVLGFEVFDQGLLLGDVIGFMDNGAQDLLRVQKKESKKEHLVPFVEPFIERIDFEEKRIHMLLPEGLIE